MVEHIHAIVDVIYEVVVGLAAALAFLTYRKRLRHDRARWAVLLFEKFFEAPQYRLVRDALDCKSGTPQAKRVAEMVHAETGEFTDYLNFFELVAYLEEQGEIDSRDFDSLFAYYVGCLRRHAEVIAYIEDEDKGFEHLRRKVRENEKP